MDNTPKKKNKNRSVHFYSGLESYVQELADKNKRTFNNQINVIIEEHKENKKWQQQHKTGWGLTSHLTT